MYCNYDRFYAAAVEAELRVSAATHKRKEDIKMATKTNSSLVTYAKAQLGLPYWYGTFGNTATAALYASKKAQYPSYYTAKDFPNQYGKRVHDCVGLIKGYIWSDSATAAPKYNAAQDKSASGMYSVSTLKGTISSFPKHAGQLVYKGASVSGIYHVGIYDGKGYVIEAKSHLAGVVKTAYKQNDWQYWSQCPYITDDTQAVKTTTPASTTPTAADVKKAITKLVDHGIINTPEYWEQNYSKVQYLDVLICNMADKL